MTSRRTILTGAAALGASAGLPGLGLAQAPAGAPRRGGTLRMSVDQAVGKLNPLLTRVNPEYLVAELLYSGLTRLSQDMTPEPDLAESWTSSPDLLRWTFALRPNLQFHDGSALHQRRRRRVLRGDAGPRHRFSGAAEHRTDRAPSPRRMRAPSSSRCARPMRTCR